MCIVFIHDVLYGYETTDITRKMIKFAKQSLTRKTNNICNKCKDCHKYPHYSKTSVQGAPLIITPHIKKKANRALFTIKLSPN